MRTKYIPLLSILATLVLCGCSTIDDNSERSSDYSFPSMDVSDESPYSSEEIVETYNISYPSGNGYQIYDADETVKTGESFSFKLRINEYYDVDDLAVKNNSLLIKGNFDTDHYLYIINNVRKHPIITIEGIKIDASIKGYKDDYYLDLRDYKNISALEEYLLTGVTASYLGTSLEVKIDSSHIQLIEGEYIATLYVEGYEDITPVNINVKLYDGYFDKNNATDYSLILNENDLIESIDVNFPEDPNYGLGGKLSEKYFNIVKDNNYVLMRLTFTIDTGSVAFFANSGLDNAKNYYPTGNTLELELADLKTLHFVGVDHSNDGYRIASHVQISNIEYFNEQEYAKDWIDNLWSHDNDWWYDNILKGGVGSWTTGVNNENQSVGFTTNGGAIINNFIDKVITAGYKQIGFRYTVDTTSTVSAIIAYRQDDSAIKSWIEWGNKTSVYFVIDLEDFETFELPNLSFEIRPSVTGGYNIILSEFAFFSEEDNVITVYSGTSYLDAGNYDYTQDIYVEFKYLEAGKNTRSIIWGKTSKKALNAFDLSSCTLLSDGYYQYKIKANELDEDGKIYLSTDYNAIYQYRIHY